MAKTLPPNWVWDANNSRITIPTNDVNQDTTYHIQVKATYNGEETGDTENFDVTLQAANGGGGNGGGGGDCEFNFPETLDVTFDLTFTECNNAKRTLSGTVVRDQDSYEQWLEAKNEGSPYLPSVIYGFPDYVRFGKDEFRGTVSVYFDTDYEDGGKLKAIFLNGDIGGYLNIETYDNDEYEYHKFFAQCSTGNIMDANGCMDLSETFTLEGDAEAQDCDDV